MRIMLIGVLLLLGLAIGFVIGWAWNVDAAPALFFGLVLVVVGAIIGFVIEWLIDVAYRRNRELRIQLSEQGKRATALGTDVGNPGPESEIISETLTNLLRERDDELRDLRGKLTELGTHLDKVEDDFSAYQQSHPDDLTVIKGIGPVYQRKLRDIGLNSYRQLVEAEPDRIRRMLDIKKWQRVDVESWIKQARDWT